MKGPLTFEDIRRRVATYEPRLEKEAAVPRAAVAMVLRQVEEDVELLLIERATRHDDPWSGHMAFPGGRREPRDPDVVHTALRETREEVGIDLVEDAEVVGRLDEIRASARHRPHDLIISPIVCTLRNTVELELEPREVESAIWVPMSFLLSPGARAACRRSFGGKEIEFPAFCYERYTVWGLTHRILEGFLDLVTEQVGTRPEHLVRAGTR